jgi:YbbR domain-containing protein
MKRRSKFQEFFQGKLPLWGASFLAAFSLWLYLVSGQNADERRIVKIQYTRIPQGLTFESTPLKEVALGISGPLYLIRNLREEDLTYLVDLSSAKSGANRIELSLDVLKLPLELEASFPSPRVFYVYLEEMISRQLPVRPQMVGNLAEGLTLGDLRVRPDRVTLSGPRSIVNKLESVDVEVSLEGQTQSFSTTARPRLAIPSVEVREVVTIDVDISTRRVTRDYSNVPVQVSGSQRVTISPPLATVSIEGPEAEVNRLSWQPVVLIKSEGLSRGRYLLRGQVSAPEKMKVLEVQPSQFLVEVLETPAPSR